MRSVLMSLLLALPAIAAAEGMPPPPPMASQSPFAFDQAGTMAPPASGSSMPSPSSASTGTGGNELDSAEVVAIGQGMASLRLPLAGKAASASGSNLVATHYRLVDVVHGKTQWIGGRRLQVSIQSDRVVLSAPCGTSKRCSTDNVVWVGALSAPVYYLAQPGMAEAKSEAVIRNPGTLPPPGTTWGTQHVASASGSQNTNGVR